MLPAAATIVPRARIAAIAIADLAATVRIAADPVVAVAAIEAGIVAVAEAEMAAGTAEISSSVK